MFKCLFAPALVSVFCLGIGQSSAHAASTQYYDALINKASGMGQPQIAQAVGVFKTYRLELARCEDKSESAAQFAAYLDGVAQTVYQRINSAQIYRRGNRAEMGNYVLQANALIQRYTKEHSQAILNKNQLTDADQKLSQVSTQLTTQLISALRTNVGSPQQSVATWAAVDLTRYKNHNQIGSVSRAIQTLKESPASACEVQFA